jgi:hypothetical protein
MPPLGFSSSLIAFSTTAYGGNQSRHIQIQRTNLQFKHGKDSNSSWFFEFGKPILIKVRSSGIADNEISDTADILYSPETRNCQFDNQEFSSEITPLTTKQLEIILDDREVQDTSDQYTDMFDIWPCKGQIDYGELKLGIQITVRPPVAPIYAEEPSLTEEPGSDLIENADSNAILFKISKDKLPRTSRIANSRKGTTNQKDKGSLPTTPSVLPDATTEINTPPPVHSTPFLKALFAFSDPEVVWILPCKITEGATNRLGLGKEIPKNVNISLTISSATQTNLHFT